MGGPRVWAARFIMWVRKSPAGCGTWAATHKNRRDAQECMQGQKYRESAAPLGLMRFWFFGPTPSGVGYVVSSLRD